MEGQREILLRDSKRYDIHEFYEKASIGAKRYVAMAYMVGDIQRPNCTSCDSRNWGGPSRNMLLPQDSLEAHARTVCGTGLMRNVAGVSLPI